MPKTLLNVYLAYFVCFSETMSFLNYPALLRITLFEVGNGGPMQF